MSKQRLPEWVSKGSGDGEAVHRIKKLLRARKLHTVCESALCPNLGECFSRNTATFMILGNECTRACGFCAVGSDVPGDVDPEEPKRIAQAARELGLKHIVITSVTRDDLADGGSAQFAETIRVVRDRMPESTIEVLTPDFQGDRDAIRTVVEAGPNIYNHNLETVPRLYTEVRSLADYRRSLDLLFYVKWCNKDLLTKSGMMLGLGETRDEVISVMRDLKDVSCDLLTIGQYLRPRKENIPVVSYVSVDQFVEYEEIGREMGFLQIMSGPLVSSSFHAQEMVFRASSKVSTKQSMNADKKKG